MAHRASDMDPARTIITADFHPALEDALLESLDVRRGGGDSDQIPIVVPTNLLALRLSRALAVRIDGHQNVRFLTLKDFAATFASLPLDGNRAILPKRADEVILRRLLDDGAAEGGYFDAIAERPGLATAVLKTIRDLKEAWHDPESFAAGARAAGLMARGRGRQNKLRELGQLWSAYEEFKEREGWADDLDLMRAAVTSLEAGEAAGRPPLLLYGFYDLNALQKRLVSAYARTADTTVFFPYVDIEQYRYARRTLDWFLAGGFERRTCPGGNERGVPLPPETVVISAPGEAREAREDVRRIVRLLEEHGLTYQDVAVLTRSAKTYSDLFGEEFANLGARPYRETPPPLSRTRPGRALVKLTEAVMSGFARRDVLEFLSLAELMPCALPDSAEPRDTLGAPGCDVPVSDWNKATMLAGVTSGRDGWLERLGALRTRLLGAESESSFAAAHGHLVHSIGPLAEIIETLASGLPGIEERDSVSGFLDRFVAVFRAITRPTKERESVLESAGAVTTLTEAAGRIGFPYFAELLREQLDRPAPREERFGRDGPAILNVMAARGLTFPVVIVPGLVEKAFPTARRQDPILLDFERDRLNGTRGNDPLGSLPDRSHGSDEEKLLFRLAVASASKVALLSFPRLDPATARPRVASIFVLHALTELTGTPHNYEALEMSDRVERIPLSRRFPARRIDALARDEFDGCSILSAVAEGDPREIAYLVQENGPLPRRLAMEATRWGRPFFTPYDGAVTSEKALEAVAALAGYTRDGTVPGKTISATALEEYALCPFRFFMHHVLKIEPVDEPEEALELSPRDRGSLYHTVLDGYMKDLRSAGRLPLGARDRGALFDAAERLVGLGSWSLAGLAGARALELRSLRTNLALWFAGEVLERTDYVPSYFEARFGAPSRKGDDPELSFEDGVPYDALGDVHVEFGGKIDRIDLTPDERHARVIDYKTGRPQTAGKRSNRKFDKGRRLQLPIYLLAARRMLDAHHPEAVVEAAEYRYVAAGEKFELTADDLETRADDLSKAVGLIVKGIATGMFFQYPEDNRCRNCDYADACASSSVALAAMKNDDRKAKFYTEGLNEVA
jgi:ATP-dependent helicase/nuclease subunit B